MSAPGIVHDGQSAELVPIASIVEDNRFQVRVGGVNERHVERLMETFADAPESMPPVLVACDRADERSRILVAGWHRLEAARRLGWSTVPARVVTSDEIDSTLPLEFALTDLAFRDNLRHGSPLTLDDRRKYAISLLAHFPDLPDREIGRRAGLSATTIGKLRRSGGGAATRERNVRATKRPAMTRGVRELVTHVAYCMYGHDESVTLDLDVLADGVLSFGDSQRRVHKEVAVLAEVFTKLDREFKKYAQPTKRSAKR